MGFSTVLKHGIVSQVGELSFPTSGLISYYRFDETSGTVAYDSHNGYDLTKYNTVITSNAMNNNALDFSDDTSMVYGSSSYFNFERTDSFTFSLWVTNLVNDVQRRFINKQIGNPYTGYRFLQTDINFFQYELRDTDGKRIIVDSSDLYDLTGYHHYVFTYDGSSDANGLKIFIDGQEINLTINKNEGLTGSIQNNERFTIGNWDTYQTRSQRGYMDEIGVWNRVLTQEEISNLYNDGNGLFYRVDVTGISLDTNTADIQEDDTYQLNYTITPSNATNKDVTWSSSDETKATVDSNGLVTAVGNVDDTFTITITTEDGGYTDSCDFTIIEAVFEATGGNVYDDSGYRYHEFTSDGTFTVESSSSEIEYLIVAGGGNGGRATNGNGGNSYRYLAGGGGAGGLKQGTTTVDSNTGNYSINVGSNEQNSSAFGVTSNAGGRGGDAGYSTSDSEDGHNGGSGGGGAGSSVINSVGYGGSGISGQGYDGAKGSNGNDYSGGGGGKNSAASEESGGNGKSVWGSTYSKGGNGRLDYNNGSGSSAAANTGNGGQGGAVNSNDWVTYNGGNGGSGIVIIRYPI